MVSLQACTSQFDFVEAPLKEIFSPVTSDLLKDPHQTLCCGNHLSLKTVTKLQQDGEPCPLCKKTLKTVPDKFFQRRLNQLQVRCSNKSQGCEWVGKLGSLEKHLSRESVEGECQFVAVACPCFCGGRFQRCELEEHKTTACPNRPITCQYCQETTCSKASSEHQLVCKKVPIECTNRSLGCEWNGLRGDLDTHMNENSVEGECQFVIVACPYSCGVYLHRYQLKNHTVNDCSHRPFTCEHCGEDSFYNKITTEHQPVCQKYPIDCPSKSLGCEWAGIRGHLDAHLNENSVKGECQFVMVACPYSCGVYLHRYQLKNHMVDDCSNRPFTCEHCGEDSSYDKITTEHQLVCQKYPIDCPNKSLGCEWAGIRGHLDTHLNENSVEGECQFVIVACSYSCGVHLHRYQLKNHTVDDCSNRPFTCEHCGEDSSYDKITTEHQPVCQKYPIDCPSKSLGCEWAGVRGQLDAHLNESSVEGECQFVTVACPYSCSIHLHRHQLKKHMDNDCSNRPFTCEHCGEDFPYTKITSEHQPVCKKYPIECPNKSLGCEWIGVRGDLDTHLNKDSVAGECQYATVDCPHLCSGGKFQRHELEEHTTNDCPNRPVACLHCGQEFPYVKATGEHQFRCQKYPIDCPNKSLGCEWAGVRGDLDAHLNEDSVEGECQFMTVACTNFCGSNCERHQLEEHKANECPNHRVTLWISGRGHKATYNKVTSEHQPDRQQHPIDCPNKSLGCEWTGVQGDLDLHLNEDSAEGECPFVTVACPYSCGTHFQRSLFEEHKMNDCPNRPPTCQYCNCEPLHNKPMNEHLSVCKKYPLECPNQCGENAIERQCLLKHLNETCPLQLVKCDFSHAGCEVECQRQHMQTHLDENMKSHLAKLSCKTEQQQQVIEQYKNQTDALISELNRVVGPSFGPPFDIVMADFEKHKKAGDEWYSPPFYSHIQGYRMCLEVDANGHETGKGTHISVYVYLMHGEHDDQLKWPFRGDIIIQLLNQRSDEGHWEKTLSIDDEVDDVYASRVVGQDRAYYAQGYNQFIPYTELRAKDKEYLKNESLKFRISKVTVKSV